jgi:hypothetical protein
MKMSLDTQPRTQKPLDEEIPIQARGHARAGHDAGEPILSTVGMSSFRTYRHRAGRASVRAYLRSRPVGPKVDVGESIVRTEGISAASVRCLREWAMMNALRRIVPVDSATSSRSTARRPSPRATSRICLEDFAPGFGNFCREVAVQRAPIVRPWLVGPDDHEPSGPYSLEGNGLGER